VKGEILYKFGNLFKSWHQNMEKVQKQSYDLIAKAEVIAQTGYRDESFDITAELEAYVVRMTNGA
jgi:hypothetical protein